jgi:hypothetical protein
MAPRLERISVGVSEIARDLDRAAARRPDPHPPTPKLGALLAALADAVGALGHQLDAPRDEHTMRAALQDVRLRRDENHQAATRRAPLAVDADGGNALDPAADEWLEYAAVLVQADAIVADLLPLYPMSGQQPEPEG